MGTVRFIDTRSSGDSDSIIEYEFESYADFKDYLESQRQAAATVVNNMMFGGGFDSPTEDLEGDEGFCGDDPRKEPSVVDIKVGKKPKGPTKH